MLIKQTQEKEEKSDNASSLTVEVREHLNKN